MIEPRTECQICQGVKIAGIVGAFVLSCHIYEETHKCPFLPDEKHTQQEVQVPQIYRNLTVVTATAPVAVTHGRLLGTAENPYRQGEIYSFIDVTASIVNR